MPRLYAWQRDYARRLRKVLRKQGVALVQLPTGSGKTAIALAAIAGMRPRPKRIIVAMPRRMDAETTPWWSNLKLGGFGHVESPEDMGLEVHSHRDLSRKGWIPLLRYRRGQRYSRGFRSHLGSNSVVILDEVHRAKSLLKELERFRPNGSRKKLFVVFVSATPVNPVRIQDHHAQAELSQDLLDKLEFSAIKTGYLRLYRALANLARKEAEVEALNSAKTLEDAAIALKELEESLEPIPRSSEMKRHRAPKATPRLSKRFLARRIEAIEPAVEGMVHFMSRLDSRSASLGSATAERFAIARCLPEGIRSRISTEPAWEFAKTARHNKFSGNYASDRLLRNPALAALVTGMDYKLLALRDYLRSHFSNGHEAGRVLIFCRYRRTVWWLSAWLERERRSWAGEGLSGLSSLRALSELERLYHGGSGRAVWDTETYSRHGSTESRSSRAKDAHLIRCFNKGEYRPRGLVLVTSDRLSESVDLHKDCDVLIHFDLDWSPLRMMQRVGRLWRHGRLRKASHHRGTVLPPFPDVFHLRYPCSVDDEIYNRLDRRWSRLEALQLGLDFIPFSSCVGRELGGWNDRVAQLAHSLGPSTSNL